MASQAHISAMADRHRALEAAIVEETTRPFADNLKISELKREKLRIKEGLSQVRESSGAAA